MKKLLLFTLFFGTAPMFSQEAETQGLLAIKTNLEKEIVILQDSLDQVTRRIDILKSEVPPPEPTEKYTLGPNELMALEKLLIRLEPDLDSKIVLELEKDTPVLKIDLIGDFYLVCYKGTCGYAPRASLEATKNGKKKDETGSA